MAATPFSGSKDPGAPITAQSGAVFGYVPYGDTSYPAGTQFYDQSAPGVFSPLNINDPSAGGLSWYTELSPAPASGATGGSTVNPQQGTAQGWADRLAGQAQTAQNQAASQAIADEYNDAGNAADAAAGYGGPQATATSQPSSISRLGDTSKWGAMSGQLAPHQVDAATGGMGDTDNVYVTVPVDKVVVSNSGAAQIRPLSANGRGYRDNGGGIPHVGRRAALPSTPAGAGSTHPSQL